MSKNSSSDSFFPFSKAPSISFDDEKLALLPLSSTTAYAGSIGCSARSKEQGNLRLAALFDSDPVAGHHYSSFSRNRKSLLRLTISSSSRRLRRQPFSSPYRDFKSLKGPTMNSWSSSRVWHGSTGLPSSSSTTKLERKLLCVIQVNLAFLKSLESFSFLSALKFPDLLSVGSIGRRARSR